MDLTLPMLRMAHGYYVLKHTDLTDLTDLPMLRMAHG